MLDVVRAGIADAVRRGADFGVMRRDRVLGNLFVQGYAASLIVSFADEVLACFKFSDDGMELHVLLPDGDRYDVENGTLRLPARPFSTTKDVSDFMTVTLAAAAQIDQSIDDAREIFAQLWRDVAVL